MACNVIDQNLNLLIDLPAHFQLHARSKANWDSVENGFESTTVIIACHANTDFDGESFHTFHGPII